MGSRRVGRMIESVIAGGTTPAPSARRGSPEAGARFFAGVESERLGADAALRDAGIQPGDTVRVGAVELEWEAEPWSTRR